MTNAQIAEALEELAVLYQLDGADQYRVLAYTNSARTIKNEGRSVEEMARNGTITELPGVGKTLEEKILALVETGEIPAAAKLKEKIPVGLLEISRIPGLGPKTVRRLHDELDVTGPEDLRAAAEAQKVRELKGLGPKVEEKILAGLDKLEAEPEGPTRLRLDEILPTAQDLVEALRSEPSCDKAEIAGSVRRLTETCHDIDLIATSTDPKALATEIAGHELVGEHGKPSDKGVKLTTNSGIDVDVRIVEPDAFGNLLQHFSGSGAHNAELRERAVAKGLHVSENGIKHEKTGEVELFTTEEEVYERLGYQYIPPELREDRGELDAAEKGELPDLVERSQIKGDLHCHTTLSDGVASMEEMAAAAEALSYEYLAITDHSLSHGFGNNVEPDRLWQRIEEIAEFNNEDHAIRLLSGSEVNIHPNGSVDYDDDLLEALDWVIASVHTAFDEDEDKMTGRMITAIENPLVDCIGHPTGRLINQRDPYPLDMERVIAAAAENDTLIEINGNPRRRDLNEIHARMAAEAGVGIVINTDAHRPDTLDFMDYGIATARRAWLTAEQVKNTGSWWK
ncbi:MAG: DNA polymerase/3'-5' exonuclease PolX [Solirubrobacterales bacterium]|nr:DNA polymerase/3'-5' exonuclease PolX [Solirubrobacterales bacterium]HRV60190.1 DNA polymerase/3'-5' exonuclease PolX [Solirubrobacterales bacterium]